MSILEQWRVDAGLSRAELAAKAHIARDTIRLLEQGKCRPHIRTAVRLASALGRTTREVLDAIAATVAAQLA